MVRVAHVVPHDGLGGVEVAARSMASNDGLSCDFRLVFIAGRTVNTAVSRIIDSPYRTALNPLAHLRALSTCLKFDPHVLICSLWRSVPIALAVRFMQPDTKIVYFLNAERAVHIFDRLFSRIAIAIADEVWGDSSATLLARLPSRKINGRLISFVTEHVDPAGVGPTQPQARFVVWARLTQQKGIDRAIEFIGALVARGVDARFDIWGPDGGELAALKELASQRELEDRVTFRGPMDRKSLADIASRSSFFLQPSRFEGMSMACVEAMQFGLLPVVTAVGEMGQYVEPNVTGVILEPSKLEAGVDQIVALLKEPALFAEMRRNAMDIWRTAPLYSDDVCNACEALTARD